MAFFILSPEERGDRFTALPVRGRNYCQSIQHHIMIMIITKHDHKNQY
jgi:hypothetical protein